MALFRQHPVREDALSAYVDAALSGADQTRVEGHLEVCERCRAAVAELRAVRSAVQELPHERAPRSFALRQVDVETTRPAAPSGLLRASPMLGAVATIALLAFFSLVGLDVAGGPSSAGNRSAGAPSSLDLPSVAESATDGAMPQEEPVRNSAEDAASVEPQAGATPGENMFSLNSPAATAPAAQPAKGAEATAPPQLAATGDAAKAREDDDRTGLRAAEAATAAVALVAGGTFAFAWWRRRV